MLMNITLEQLYGVNEKILSSQKTRFSKLTKQFISLFKAGPEKYFSSPGRTEISGNHTDHNHGKVIAASVNLDSIAAASPNFKDEIVIYSESYSKPFVVSLKKLNALPGERFSTLALVRGIAFGLKKRGYSIGGFNAYIMSDVLRGSGLSSSASIEVLIGTIFNHLFNKGKISPVEIAIVGQFAENEYFGKPCGLMDQIACSVGGIVAINFAKPNKPSIIKINFDFNSSGYKLMVVDTGVSHADLTEDYASIPSEMKQVAEFFNRRHCSEISIKKIISKIKPLRLAVSDRAVLRGLHFIEENERVEKQINFLNKGKFNEFLKLVGESGNSSFKFLQNIYSPHNIEEQGLSIALMFTEIFIKEKGAGACRVHGGGFAGTIQVFLPHSLVDEYVFFMSKIFDKGSVKVLSIRNIGSVCVKKL